jgi:acetylornithine deacetylase/succinyl-diaminopimelate desuccinylase-like protein
VAHQPDEYVETDQLVQCRQFLDTLAARLERGPLTPA